MPSGRPSSSRSSGPRGPARATRTTRAKAGVRPNARPLRQARQRRPTSAPRVPIRARFTGRAAVLVLVLAVLMVSYASSLRAYLQQRDELKTLRSNIAQSKAEIAALTREEKRWHDPAYVRAQARQRFGWVLPGEVGFRVLGRRGKPLGSSDTLAEPAHTGPTAPEWYQTAWGSDVAAGLPKQVKHQPKPATKISLSRTP
jgi:cell division protein FtsB